VLFRSSVVHRNYYDSNDKHGGGNGE
jgi:hypothetical protein